MNETLCSVISLTLSIVSRLYQNTHSAGAGTPAVAAASMLLCCAVCVCQWQNDKSKLRSFSPKWIYAEHIHNAISFAIYMYIASQC